jgi:outer membrane protein assembly factor BamB
VKYSRIIRAVVGLGFVLGLGSSTWAQDEPLKRTYKYSAESPTLPPPPTAPQANLDKLQEKKDSTERPGKVGAAKSDKANHPASSGEWAFFRGNHSSTGVADSKLPVELDVIWEFNVKKGAFESTPTIVSDPRNVSRKIVLIGDLDGKLYALDFDNGKELWAFSSEIGFGTAPVVRDGKIYLGDLDGVFYCINFQGEKVWSFQADGEINSSANFYEDNVLFGSQDANLYALHANTGELAWKYESQDQIRCSITVAADRAFVAGCDGYFHVINLRDGSGVGKVEIRSPTGSTPAALGSRVFFGTQTGEFFAVDSQQVKVDWSIPPQRESSDIIGSPAVDDEHVIYGTRGRSVYSLKPKTGEQNWEATLKAKIDSSPVIVGERVYIASTDGRLYALALRDGSIEWERQFNGGFVGSPAVAFGRMVIATNRGTVYCLGEKKN